MKCAWDSLMQILPHWLKAEANKRKNSLQEIRLRLGDRPRFLDVGGFAAGEGSVRQEDLHFILNTACRYSPWTASGAKQGYLTAPGGHRIGLCGETVTQEGAVSGFRNVRSMNIRICRDFPGVSGKLSGLLGSILVLGPPGSGKTTLLRDLIRQISQKEVVCVADERGELFPPLGEFERGVHLDVLTGCSKAEGLDMLIRTMGPATVAVDEITGAEDARALLMSAFSGVRLLATAHGGSVADWKHREVYKPLLENKVFDFLVLMQPDKSYQVERIRL